MIVAGHGLTSGQSEGLGDLNVPVRRVLFASQPAQILFLRQMVNEYSGNEVIRQKAHSIIFEEARCPPRAPACHALAVGSWVQRNITYVNEAVETFQSPWRTLTYRYGDCDDFTTLIASLLESVGVPTELVGLEWNGEYRHIFPRAIVGQAPDGSPLRLPLDATLDTPITARTNPIAVLIGRGTEPRAFIA